MGIGKKLSDILSMQNRNPNELAEKIGESPSTIYSIIKRDNLKVDISVLAKICKELNVKMDIFYSEYIGNLSSEIPFNCSDHEKQLLIAYRKQPTSVQEAIDRMLGIDSADSAQKQQRA